MRKLYVTAAATAAALACGACGTTPHAATAPKQPADTVATPPATTVPTTPPPSTAPPTTVPAQEQNAIRAAQQYLAMGSGFSQAGLIQQLSSSAGDGYPAAIAAAAVASLNVDWDAQAVLAAKTYLQTSSFSCSALVQQLDSAAGSQFTAAQAQYGAKAAGIC